MARPPADVVARKRPTADGPEPYDKNWVQILDSAGSVYTTAIFPESVENYPQRANPRVRFSAVLPVTNGYLALVRENWSCGTEPDIVWMDQSGNVKNACNYSCIGRFESACVLPGGKIGPVGMGWERTTSPHQGYSMILVLSEHGDSLWSDTLESNVTRFCFVQPAADSSVAVLAIETDRQPKRASLAVIFFQHNEPPVHRLVREFASEFTECVGMVRMNDGGYLIAGTTVASWEESDVLFWAFRLSSTGDIQWQSDLGPSIGYLLSMQGLSDGSIAIMGYEGVMNITTDGAVNWIQSYKEEFDSIGAHCVVERSDRSLLIAGLDGYYEATAGGTIIRKHLLQPDERIRAACALPNGRIAFVGGAVWSQREYLYRHPENRKYLGK